MFLLLDLGARRTERSPRTRLLPGLSVQPPPPSPRTPRVQGCAAVRKGARVSGQGVGARGAVGEFRVCPRREAGSRVGGAMFKLFSFLAAEPSVPSGLVCPSQASRLRDLARLCRSRGQLSGVSGSDTSTQPIGTRVHLPPSSCPPRQPVPRTSGGQPWWLWLCSPLGTQLPWASRSSSRPFLWLFCSLPRHMETAPCLGVLGG